LRSNQVAVLGSKTPMVGWPSLVQSPSTGMLPALRERLKEAKELLPAASKATAAARR
jgi:hypothetical protein